jgi:hypothetical protein
MTAAVLFKEVVIVDKYCFTEDEETLTFTPT